MIDESHPPSAARPFRSIMKGLALTFLVASASQAFELADIMAASRIAPPARVPFQEERYNPLLEEPLVLDGYLEYLDRGVMSKVVESPYHESFLIEHGKIRLQRDGETREVSLNRSQALATVVVAIEAILSGNAGRIESLFDYQISGTAGDWSIELTPKSRRRNLSQVTVSGGADTISRIKIDLRDGEWQVMKILRKTPAP